MKDYALSFVALVALAVQWSRLRQARKDILAWRVIATQMGDLLKSVDKQKAELSRLVDTAIAEAKKFAEERRYHMNQLNRLADKVGALGMTSEQVVDIAIKLAHRPGPKPGMQMAWTVTYGGGVGPDVWDATRVIKAVDIFDALSQATGIVDEGGWIISVEQNP